MKNRINLTNFNVRTDLIIDNQIEENYLNKEKINNSITLLSNLKMQLTTKMNKK